MLSTCFQLFSVTTNGKRNYSVTVEEPFKPRSKIPNFTLGSNQNGGAYPMSDFGKRLFEGMDTPDGAMFGMLSLGTSFFPFFNSFLRIFHAPTGWNPWAAGVLATFACVFIKLLINTYHREMAFELKSVQMAAIAFILCLYMHYAPPLPPEYHAQEDLFMNLTVYVGLFATPTFAFTAMQFRKKREQ